MSILFFVQNREALRADVGIRPYNPAPGLNRCRRGELCSPAGVHRTPLQSRTDLVVGTAVPSRPRTGEDTCPYKPYPTLATPNS